MFTGRANTTGRKKSETEDDITNGDNSEWSRGGSASINRTSVGGSTTIDTENSLFRIRDISPCKRTNNTIAQENRFV